MELGRGRRLAKKCPSPSGISASPMTARTAMPQRLPPGMVGWDGLLQMAMIIMASSARAFLQRRPTNAAAVVGPDDHARAVRVAGADDRVPRRQI